MAAAHHRADRRPSRTGAATGCSSLADQYTSRGPDGYTDNSTEALYAVNCLDHDDYVPSERGARATSRSSRRPRRRSAASSPTAWPRARRGRSRAASGPGALARRGCAADRGDRYDARPGHAVRLGQGAGLAARLRACWSAATATATPASTRATSASTTRSRRYLVGGNVPAGRPVLLRPVPRFGDAPHPAPILVRRARLTGRALRRLSSVGRASHS